MLTISENFRHTVWSNVHSALLFVNCVLFSVILFTKKKKEPIGKR